MEVNPLKGYCAIGVTYPGKDSVQLIAVEGMVPIWDNLITAQSFAEYMGHGRVGKWSIDKETYTFMDVVPEGYSSVVVVTNYDPYNVPTGWVVPSEVKLTDWKHHVHYTNVYEKLRFFTQESMRRLPA